MTYRCITFDRSCVLRLIGKMVADGSPIPGREDKTFKVGTVLKKVLWSGFPPEVATWEEEDDIPCGEVDFVGDYEAALQAEDEDGEEEVELEVGDELMDKV